MLSTSLPLSIAEELSVYDPKALAEAVPMPVHPMMSVNSGRLLPKLAIP